MGENHSLSSHIRSARNWLFKAEQSFDNRNELQGKLHLMLAQAEMQYARENKEPWHLSWKVQGLAIVLAGLTVSAGLGLAYFSHFNQTSQLRAAEMATAQTETESSAPQSSELKPMNQPVPDVQEAAKITTEPITAPETFAIAPSRDVSSAKKIVAQTSESVRPTAVATPKPEEVEHLVRVAGKSLRTP